MSYRPIPCHGIADGRASQCQECIRFHEVIPEDQIRIRTPDLHAGRCLDRIPGRPRAVVEVREAPSA